MVSQDIWVVLGGIVSSVYLYRRSHATKYPTLQLEAIFLYPIKSLPPIQVSQATLAERGLQGDRTFMLVSPKSKAKAGDGNGLGKGKEDEWFGHYISDRPKNALLIPTLSSDHSFLTITAPNGTQFTTPLLPNFTTENRRIKITMHSSSAETIDLGDEASRFFTEACGTVGEEVRLVYMVPKERREVLGSMGGNFYRGLAFQDCASYMIASSASLEAVRSQLDEPLSIIPFRPTFLVSPQRGHSLASWVEDWWAELRIAEKVSIRLTSNCVRCVSLNIDYAKGKFKTGSNLPFKILTKTRLVDPGQPYSPVFGRYGFSQNVGETISVGDVVRVTKLNKSRTVFDWPL
ncbi:BZ3500_MvSof-1268-A1-R1_Chr3-2g06342 [Microbotryum saponariae]|uniref:BZ3500_MvSof-1268-A1-R1_Chr3-2g06342 protein n=1 Tax=Microbotryum saponariae TaxID=289078 RepID=A0A2X0L228_9BASI|nr:BZ3500_MvSof-1268-A1-R1_Chr3-2g06342 [Microbotryum saponariae]SDA04313.1 BZ3501_MvSof-1269-A2-R1_Chr3-2g06033 [Microbotryum saponariae]